MKKTRSSTRIAIAFALVVAAAYFGYGFISSWMVDRQKFAPIKPGNVNIVGVDTSKGYYIVVANQIAQLVRGNVGQFQAADHDEAASEASEKKRVPVREMLQSLQGDEKALGKFIMVMNDMSDAEFPAYPVIWKAEDIRKAAEGDEKLRKQLESDLNVRLDGTPLEQVRTTALQEGILIDSPVDIEAQIGADRKRLVGRVQEQYVPRFCRNVWDTVSTKSNLNQETIVGYYRAEAQKLFDKPVEKENVKQTLLGRINPARLQGLAEAPERILDSAQVIVNDDLIESAEYEGYKTSDGKQLYDLILNLTDEGRLRLWQFSKRKPNAQLLVTWEGIAIAAPRIQGELALSRVSVKQLADEGLVRDTVDSINQAKKEGKN